MASAGIGRKVEGFHAVAAAVAAGRIREIWVEESRLRSPDVAELIDRAEAAGCYVERVESVLDHADTSAPQGLVAMGATVPLHDLVTVCRAADKPALLMLDHIEDPRNVGAIARSALAAGIDGIVVPERRAAPLGATAFKAAAGALETLPVVEVSSMADAVRRVSSLGIWVVGLDGAAEQSLFGHSLFTEPVAVVVGAEGSGISRLVRDRCDALAAIPMSDAVESLNASVAAGIVAFEIARVRADDRTGVAPV